MQGLIEFNVKLKEFGAVAANIESAQTVPVAATDEAQEMTPGPIGGIPGGLIGMEDTRKKNIFGNMP